MIDAIRAEALKLYRHPATWLMVWIYPIVIALIVVAMVVHGAIVSPGVPGPPESVKTAADWIHAGTFLWNAPASPPGRFLIAGFAALVFAGEYGWNTWKLLIPARSRWQLIAAKWAVTLCLIVLALVAADLIGLIGDWLGSLQGEQLPAGVTLLAIAEAHATACGYALVPIVYTITLAGLFAVLTRSILATVILSIMIIVLEGMLPLLGLLAYQYAPGLTAILVKGLPLYHMVNLNAWTKGVGFVLPLGPGAIISMSWATSFCMLAAWIVTAGAVTQLRFWGQDMN